MKLQHSFIFIFITLIFGLKSIAQETPLTPIQKLNCSTLKTKAQSKDESLRGLFLIRYLQQCNPTEGIELSSLTEFEKQIYSSEIKKLTPLGDVDSPEITVAELKKKLQAETQPQNKLKLFLALRQKYKNDQKPIETAKTVDQLYSWSRKLWLKNKKNTVHKKIYTEVITHKARYLWNTGQLNKAIQLINTGLKTFNNESIIDFYFLKGRIYEDLQKYERAGTHYRLTEKALRNTKTNLNQSSELVTLEKIIWIQGWLFYKLKNYKKAIVFFDQLIEETKDPSEKSRALFFKAQSLFKMNQKDLANEILEINSSLDQYSFYSIVSALQLSKKLNFENKFENKKTSSFVNDTKLSFLSDTKKNIFQSLVRYEEVDILEKSIPYYTSNINEQLQLSIHIAKSFQRYQSLFSVFSQFDIESKMIFLSESKEFIFPTPYLKKVKELSEQYQVPLSLVYSLMKQESSFNPYAQSAAQALGLMQVIPTLAVQIQKKHKLKILIPDDLFDPEKNIELGIIELKEQIKKQNNQLILVACAYNAGPSALKKWLNIAKQKKWDIYEFIEEIPYDETRTYVKIMARNLMYYDSIFQKQNQNIVSQQFLNWPSVSK